MDLVTKFKVALICTTVIATSVLASDLQPRKSVKDLGHSYKVVEQQAYQGIILKFAEGTGIRLKNNKFKVKSSIKLKHSLPKKSASWLELNDKVVGLHDTFKNLKLKNLQPLFWQTELELEDLKITGEKKAKKELADLNLYFHLAIPEGIDTQSLQDIVNELNAISFIETAYADPVPQNTLIQTQCPGFDDCGDFPPPGGGGTSTTTPSFVGNQGYLLPASQGGIDAQYAWTVPGGNGSGIKVIDIEHNWNFSHEDLNSAFYQYGTGSGSTDHGTAVLGVMGGKSGSTGITGIAYGAQFGSAKASSVNISPQLINAAAAVGAGGVILIELHANSGENTTCSCNTPQCNFVALEYWSATFAAIQTVTAQGVTVVEAAGNGSVNLDSAYYDNIFNRSYQDSGAILVGASNSTNHTPMCWTNHGSRVDVHGWGENVVTLGFGDLYNDGANKLYTDSFNGTSSATPIVAGAVASYQGYKKATSTVRTPLEVRAILVANGTAQASSNRHIGPMPDLKKIIQSDSNISTSLTAPTLNALSSACYGYYDLDWNGISGANRYEIYINTSGITPTTVPTYSLTGTSKFLNVSQSSYGWVKACNSNGCSSVSNRVRLIRLTSCY